MKIDSIENLIEGAKEQGFENFILQNLYYGRIDEIDETEKNMVKFRVKKIRIIKEVN